MASIIQRILGLGFLMGSIAFGMTLARGQVDMKSLPPGAMEAARAMLENQATANSLMANAQSDRDAAPPVTAAQASGGSGTTPPPSKFVPSEVEIFQGSMMKHGEPRAIIHTTLGDIEMKLFVAQAPRTVKNFMELARGDREFSDARTSKKVRRPFYNGLTVHKVVSGEYLQMGCPLGNGRGGPGYTLPDELSAQLKFDRPGMVAMALAREGVKITKDSNGSQFFITLTPHESWDGQFTIFGEVTKGLKIVRDISAVDVGPTDRPIRKVFITAIDVIDEDGTSGIHAPAPVPAVDQPVSQPGPASVAPPVLAPPPMAAPSTLAVPPQ